MVPPLAVVSARPEASVIGVHGLVAALTQARWSENSVALSRLTSWPMTVSVLPVPSQASTSPRTSGCTCSSRATGAVAVLLLAGSTSTTCPTSSAETRVSVAPVSSSTTCAPVVAYSWSLTNTLPKAVIAPDELVVGAALGPEVPFAGAEAPPPPPQATSASASADDRAQVVGEIFMTISRWDEERSSPRPLLCGVPAGKV